MPTIPTRYKYVAVSLLIPTMMVGMVWWALKPTEWRSHLSSLFERAFRSLTTYYGTNGPGFWVSVVVSTLFAAIFTVVLMGFFKGWDAMQRHLVETLLIAVLCVAGELVVVWGPLYLRHLASVIFSDHEELASSIRAARSQNKQSSDAVSADQAGQIKQLQSELSTSRTELNARKQMLHNTDPAFSNMTNAIRAFMTWRRNIGYDAPCRILVTTPDKDDGGLYMTFITMAVFGSNCPNGDLNNVGVRRENIEAETSKGMIPGLIVFHALPDAKGANQLENELSNLFQVKRAFTIPGNASENTIWLQFGTGVKWNSDRSVKR